jgi:hypothetical protein
LKFEGGGLKFEGGSLKFEGGGLKGAGVQMRSAQRVAFEHLAAMAAATLKSLRLVQHPLNNR